MEDSIAVRMPHLVDAKRRCTVAWLSTPARVKRGLLLELAIEMGADWSEWTPLDTLVDRLHVRALRILRRRALERSDLGLPPFEPLSPFEVQEKVEQVAVYTHTWLRTLSHRHFGRPFHAWRRKDTVWLPVEDAAAIVDRAKRELARHGRTGGRLRAHARQRRADELRQYARDLHAEGWLNESIARALGVSIRTIQRYLNTDDLG